MSAIAKNYAKLCEKGVRNFYSVPDRLQNDVREIIEADGYVINEDGTVSEADKISYTASQINSMKAAEIRQLAIDNGIENQEDYTVAQLKPMLIEMLVTA